MYEIIETNREEGAVSRICGEFFAADANTGSFGTKLLHKNNHGAGGK